MKQPKYKGKERLPLSVIDAARDGDAQAVDSVPFPCFPFLRAAGCTLKKKARWEASGAV